MFARLLAALRFGTYVAGVARRSQGVRMHVTSARSPVSTSDLDRTRKLLPYQNEGRVSSASTTPRFECGIRVKTSSSI